MPTPFPPGQLSLFAVDPVAEPSTSPAPATARTLPTFAGAPTYDLPDRTAGSGDHPGLVPTAARFLAYAYGSDGRPMQERLADAERRFVARVGAGPALIAVPSGDYERYGPLDRRVVPLAHVPAGSLYLLHPGDVPPG